MRVLFMRRRFPAKQTKRELALLHNANIDYLGLPEKFKQDVPALRAPRKPSGKPLERTILADIVKALRRHPKVARVERNQSGVFREGERWIRVGSKGKLDLTCYLRDGRYIELEVKRPGAYLTSQQIYRINAIRAEGGMASRVNSVDEAWSIMEAM